MHIRLHFATAAAVAVCLIAVPAYAQELASPAASSAPAHLALIEGVVDVVLEGVPEPADPPVMLLDGDLVRTRAGRAELVLAGGTLLHLAELTVLEVLGDVRFRLSGGRVIVRVPRGATHDVVIDTPGGIVRLTSPGEVSVASTPAAALEVAAVRGTVDVIDEVTWQVSGGQMLALTAAGARPQISSFNSARWDSFAAWAEQRSTRSRMSTSAGRLPAPLRPYADVLDAAGRWDYLAPHGHVWFPSVPASWQPYQEGAWSFTRYGWTWRGSERWAWPTHHYGRWDFNGAFWYWVPATTWAPAWVIWTAVDGYVGWAPAGWHTRFDGGVWGRRDHPAYAPTYDPWRGWTVLPRQHFAPRRPVRPHAIDGGRLDAGTRQALLTGATPSPAAAMPRPAFSVPRETLPLPGRIDGRVRRPAPDTAPPRVTDPPRRSPDPPPSYVPPPASRGDAATASGAARRQRRDDGPRDAAPPATGGGDANANGSAERSTERRGAVRAPAARGAAPAAPPAGEAPSAAPRPQGTEPGAVSRGGGARRKG